jgi:hypothetical protein
MIALNHSFVAGLVRGPADEARAALALIQHCIKRTRKQPIVHETIANFDTGSGTLVRWANTRRRDPLVELLLRMLSGPFAPRGAFAGPITPPINTRRMAPRHGAKAPRRRRVPGCVLRDDLTEPDRRGRRHELRELGGDDLELA